MNPREWFVLGIRLFGLWSLMTGVGYAANFVDARLGLSQLPLGTKPNGYLFYAACDFAIAAYFLFGARHLAGICESHGERNGDTEEPGQPEGAESHTSSDQL